MPVTPFHLGPGAAVKAVAGERFSLVVFALAQVAMDLEVVARALAGSAVLHGFANTLWGATLAMLLTLAAARPIGEPCLRWWNRQLSAAQARWLGVEDRISSTAAWTGATLGVYSHWLLDAVMHADARPLAPFSATNPFLGLVSIERLEWLCLATLAVGVPAMLVRRRLTIG